MKPHKHWRLMRDYAQDAAESESDNSTDRPRRLARMASDKRLRIRRILKGSRLHERGVFQRETKINEKVFDELTGNAKRGETEHMSTKNQSMITPLIQLDVQSEKQPDIRVKPFTFESTEVEIEAMTEIGKTLFASMFGQGAVSVTMKKSTLFDFEKFANQRGVLVA